MDIANNAAEATIQGVEMFSRRSRPIQLSTVARRRKPAAAGFTLTEVLVVIGVIAVLVGIVMVGVTYVTRSSNVSATRVTLGNLQSMVAELEANAGTNRQPPILYSGTLTKNVYNPAAAYDAWKDGDVSDPNPDADPEPLITPGVVRSEADPSRSSWIKNAVANTQLMLGTLTSIPANRTSLSQLPAESLAKVGDNFFGVTTAEFNEANTPIVLDSWGNPIIFVPAAGLHGVVFEAHGPTELHTITVSGPLEPYTGTPPRPLVPGARSFWASAGPDGDFTKGDDNVYSFEN